MKRYAFGSTFVAAVLCLAFLGPGLASDRPVAWDRGESSSALFGSHEKDRQRPVLPTPKLTAMKWAVSTVDPKLRSTVLKPGFVTGVLVNLLSFQPLNSAALPEVMIRPDYAVPVCVSVSVPGNNNPNCSTASQFSSQYYCSAMVPTGSPAPPPNTLCSVGTTATPSPNAYCTANNQTTFPGNAPQTCSTAGGVSITGPPPSGNGSVGCSAGGGPPGNDSYTCSANGSIDGGNCSTYTGNHQACSAGWAFQPGDTSFCSASNAGGDAASICSVFQGATNGAYGNKCSAIDHGQRSAKRDRAMLSYRVGHRPHQRMLGRRGRERFRAQQHGLHGVLRHRRHPVENLPVQRIHPRRNAPAERERQLQRDQFVGRNYLRTGSHYGLVPEQPPLRRSCGLSRHPCQ